MVLEVAVRNALDSAERACATSLVEKFAYYAQQELVEVLGGMEVCVCDETYFPSREQLARNSR